MNGEHYCYRGAWSLMEGLRIENALSSFIKKTHLYKMEGRICKVILVLLYGCETWSLTLREEPRLRVFENRILRRIFGSERDENGEWRRLHNEELHSLYRSP